MPSYRIALMNPTGQTFDQNIDRLFQEAVSASDSQGSPWSPPCNVWEDEQGFFVQLGLPGWEPQDVTLEVANQVLSIKGERQQASPPTRKTHLQEIADGRFMRVLKLPALIDAQHASATQKNGLLTVTFPKREEAKSRRITIEG
ncbi:MAG: Heat shock protein Hsp20 [Nitrospira sp.]|nr:Heat shock protein Hsp20 [Nitrospira sp.]